MAVRGKGMGFADQVIEEDKKQGVKVSNDERQKQWDKEDEQKKQASLLETEEELPPAVVMGEMILAQFVKPHFFQSESERLCGLEFSFVLTDEHKDLIPESVVSAWKYISKSHSRGLLEPPVPAQNIRIFLAPEEKVELELLAVEIAKATICFVKESGKGESVKVPRFSFRAIADCTKNVYTFGATQFGNAVWLKMEEAQIAPEDLKAEND